MTAADHIISRLMRIAAVVCLVAVLVITGVQAVHMHAGSAAFDSHCSLCMVSHCVPRPQAGFAVALPVRVVLHTRAVVSVLHTQSPVFRWFIRPPPAA
ncbi:MAG: hypothetical protein ACRD3E_16765 [Terriglobales bacterium]